MLIRFKTAIRPTFIVCAAIIAGTFFAGCRTSGLDAPKTFAPKLPLLREFAAGAADGRPGPFEQQFRIDTGETNATRRSEFEQRLRIKGQSKDRLLLRLDLSGWPERLRSSARLWVGVGASNSFTTEVTVNLIFSQNGAGVSTGLNNSIAIDGFALMGCDFATQDGEVTIDIENLGQPRDVDYTLHAIVYVPLNLDPR